MATLQIPFSRWDWPNSGNDSSSNFQEKNHHSKKSSLNHNNNHSNNHCHSSSNSKSHNHRSDVLNCSHPKSDPIASSLSSLSAMLLEGQAVLAHQTTNAIWLFIGLKNGAIWKWTINMVILKKDKVSFYNLSLCVEGLLWLRLGFGRFTG